MERVTLAQVRQMAAEAKDELTEKALSAEHDSVKIYLHWTAGYYTTKFEDYHICIGEHGDLWAMTDDFSETLAHTWFRNGGSIGVALCCCVDATTEDLGECPPTPEQVEAMARVIAALADGLGLAINKRTVMTHGEAADNEGDNYHSADQLYGPKHGCERWDLEFLGTDESPEYNPWATDGSRGGDVLRGKANWYKERGYE